MGGWRWLCFLRTAEYVRLPGQVRHGVAAQNKRVGGGFAQALEGRSACLMSNHGMTVFGRDLEQALAHAVELEALCEQYWRVLQIGTPQLLADDEMQKVIALFQGYGQQ